jgi:hypothetical protein
MNPKENKEIRRILATQKGYICPYLNTASENVWEHVVDYQVEGLRFRYGNRADIGDRFGLNECARCNEPNCATWCGYASFNNKILVPLMNGLSHTLILQIWQKLGALRDVQDAEWVAQIDEHPCLGIIARDFDGGNMGEMV